MVYRTFTSDTKVMARRSGMIVPKSPTEPASSERLKRRIGRDNGSGEWSIIPDIGRVLLRLLVLNRFFYKG
jgi:hypothetical protein